MSLKHKTVSGLAWSFIDSFANQGLSFIIGIILARLLSPEEFGLIGMITIFLAISQSFIDSGFASALIRKKDCAPADYSTVFYYNFAVAAVLYCVLFFSASAISGFFAKPQLETLVRVLGINLVINSLGLIQKTVLTKRIDFKLLARISILSSVISGTISIIMALRGWGVWSLAAKAIVQSMCMSLLLWIWNGWRPQALFSLASFRELFGFGSKLMVSSLIDTTYKNVYYLIIGKFFSAQELGYYTRARGFSLLPSQTMTDIIQRVSYPALSTLQNDQAKLKRAYKKLIKGTMLISFTLMIGMAAVARPMVIVLIGYKWSPAVIYLQLLCFGAMLYPLHALNLNMLNVKGRSDLFLRLEILKKILVIPTIMVGITFGVTVMIIGMMVNNVIGYFLNSYWSGRMVNYPVSEQLADIAPSFFLALFVGMSMLFAGTLIKTGPVVVLLTEIVLGCGMFYILTKAVKVDSFNEIKNIIKERFFSSSEGGMSDGEI